ncbi:adenylate/guanylate cyclase domain-containing protein [Algicella marina]|uniref:FHA domain-containing protein n=1 Tax=Algicella marina TaxID=2683284 RepID=A0A6P1T3G7_9RHOB|nr:adenylate/guanylate cyclase domain-containing protein [Algicella marina]QHQ36557.1 FHA domain-containing protein [Algicella marina]
MTAACVLIADISGSTPLYEKLGNTAALAEINRCLESLKEVISQTGGEFVSSKGDDVLALFDGPNNALTASIEMLRRHAEDVLSIHAGIYWGEMVHSNENVYGKPVYTAARLASLAKPGEVLLGDQCFQMLSPENKAMLTPIGTLHLKGKPKPTEVHSYVQVGSAFVHTVTMHPRAMRIERDSYALLSCGDRKWRISEGEIFTIGRAEDCTFSLPEAWVSRQHARLTVTRGLVELVDHSSTGSFVINGDQSEIEICRQSIALTGAGSISLGVPHSEPAAMPISFEIAEIRARPPA